MVSPRPGCDLLEADGVAGWAGDELGVVDDVRGCGDTNIEWFISDKAGPLLSARSQQGRRRNNSASLQGVTCTPRSERLPTLAPWKPSGAVLLGARGAKASNKFLMSGTTSARIEDEPVQFVGLQPSRPQDRHLGVTDGFLAVHGAIHEYGTSWKSFHHAQ